MRQIFKTKNKIREKQRSAANEFLVKKKKHYNLFGENPDKGQL